MSITEKFKSYSLLALGILYYLSQLTEFLKQIINNESSMLKSELIFFLYPKWQCNFPLTLTVLHFEV